MKKFVANYPSGAKLPIEGLEFKLVMLECGLVPCIETEKGVIILDQRAIVRDELGLVYSPRDHIKTMMKEMQEWMDKNPQWGKVSDFGVR